jgi:SAM-dependent methyltransferase
VNPPTGTDDWDRHWGDYAESAENNPAQRYRTQLIFSVFGPCEFPCRLVDIGSGQGDFVAQARKRFPRAEMLGIDLSETGCRIARRKVPDATFLQRDLVGTDDVPTSFRNWATHAVLSEVLEHVDRPDLLLRHAIAYLATGCRVIVTVPGGPMSAFDRHIGHRRHYTRGALGELLEKGGLEVKRVTAAGFPFHNLYRLAVLARGRRLVADVAGSSSSSLLHRAGTRAFDLSFHLNLPATPWGWQLVAVAQLQR